MEEPTFVYDDPENLKHDIRRTGNSIRSMARLLVCRESELSVAVNYPFSAPRYRRLRTRLEKKLAQLLETLKHGHEKNVA